MEASVGCRNVTKHFMLASVYEQNFSMISCNSCSTYFNVIQSLVHFSLFTMAKKSQIVADIAVDIFH